MPPQNQAPSPSTGQAQVSEDSVRAFMDLNEEDQKTVLGKMSPENKNWLFLGVRALRSAEQQQQEAGEARKQRDLGVVAGFAKRAVGTMKGIKGLAAPATEEDAEPGRIGRGVMETYKTGARQAREQVGAGMKAVEKGAPVEGGLQIARGATTGAALLDPFATGSVVDINRMQDVGQYRESIGAGAFDALTLLAGLGFGRKPTAKTSVNKLAYATGGKATELQALWPDLAEEARVAGKPATVGQLENLVQGALDRQEATFNQAMLPLQNQLVDASSVAQQIRNLIKSDSSRAEINTINKAAQEYSLTPVRRGRTTVGGPKTMQWLNDRRMRLNAATRPIFSKESGAAAATMRSDLEMAIDKKARDAVADLQYGVLQRHNPNIDFTALKLKQRNLWAVKDQLSEQIRNLADKQAIEAGEPMRATGSVSVYAHPGGRVGAYAHHLQRVIPGASIGAKEAADLATRQAFGRTKGAVARRAAALSLPVSHLVTAGEGDKKPKRSGLKPPPQANEQ